MALFLCGYSSTLPETYLSLAMLGFCVALSNAGINISVQDLSPAELKGRIISIFYATRFGFDALGGLLAGAVATVLSAQGAFEVESVALLLLIGMLAFTSRREASTRTGRM